MALVGTACGDTTGGAASSPAPTQTSVPTLSAVAFRLREDEAVGGRFQVKVTNSGDRPVQVRAVALDSPVLANGPPTSRDTVLRPDGRVDLPVRHGAAVCEPGAEASDVTAVLTLVHDGSQRLVRLPLGATEESRAVLARIHDESCTAQRVAAVLSATITVGEPGTDAAGLVLPGTVVLERTGAGGDASAVTATAVGGSVLYGLTAPLGTLPATLPPGQARLELPVLVRSTRCSGHVLGEAKKPYEIGVWLRLDAADEQWVQVATTPAVRSALRAYLDQACGPG